MASLQIIVKAKDEALTVLSDRTIEYTHPAEIAGLYNQLITVENPEGSFIIFNEIPADYTEPNISLIATPLREGKTYQVTLIGAIIDQLERGELFGTVKEFNKTNHTVTFDLAAADDSFLHGWSPYIQKPEIIITDVEGTCRLAVVINQKMYVPQPANSRHDLPIDWPLPGQEAYVSFVDGVTTIKLTGQSEVMLVPICKMNGLTLTEYLLTHSNYDRPIVHTDGQSASVVVTEVLSQMGGRIFPKTEAEVLKVLNLIDTDPRYESIRGLYLNPYAYGEVGITEYKSGSREIIINATVPVEIANNTKKFLVGALIEKRRTDASMTATSSDTSTIMGMVRQYVGQDLQDVQMPGSGYLRRYDLLDQINAAIDFGEYYLLPIDFKIKGDSGRSLSDTLDYQMPLPGGNPSNIGALPLKIDIRYNTDFPLRDLGMRVWPATAEEYTTVKNAFTGNSVDTANWIDIFNTTGITHTDLDGARNVVWDTPPTFQGYESLGSGIAVNKAVFDAILQGNYNDTFAVGTVQSSSGGAPGPFTWQSLKDLQFKGVRIGDEYFFGPDTMVNPYNARENGYDMKAFMVNFGDDTGTRWVTNNASIQLSFSEEI